MIKLLLLMILCHLIDDFVLQGTCLVNLKQKSWWKQNAPRDLYKNDYKMGLLMYSLEWCLMINLPLILLGTPGDVFLIFSVILNTGIHYLVDDLKANKLKINLIQDQSIHLCQILLTYGIYTWTL